MLSGLFISGLHVKERKIGVNQLFVREKLLRFVPFFDGAGVIAFAVVSHAERELGVEVLRVVAEELLEFLDGAVVIGPAEIEHGVIVSYIHFDKYLYDTIVIRAQAKRSLKAVSTPIKLISTDFDGTLHSEFDTPPVARDLELLIGGLQKRGAAWVINTGRDLTSLMETLTLAGLSIRPDYVVVVEREIYKLVESDYASVEDWNQKCSDLHAELFRQVRPLMPEITSWIGSRFKARVYEDPWSPFCLIAESTSDAEAIHEYLELSCGHVGDLTIMRNDVYARFSHKAFNKGTALAEIARRLKIKPDEIVAAGDHLNDLPMLSNEYARWLVAPVNAVAEVKEAVLRQNGVVSEKHCGYGVAHGLQCVLKTLGFSLENSTP
jgi:hydroxymethylpyrimidine pyrophosphatase-like HAD family hydrolase